MDNLSLIRQKVDNDIDPNGAPGSVLALNHNEILKQILSQVGKYTGSPFLSVKDSATVPTGIFSWNGNAMNNTSQFTITVAKLTADLNDFTSVLNTLTTGSVIRFKDYVGRSVFLDYISFSPSVDGDSNDVYNIEVKGHATNPNYIYQDNEQQICVIEILIRAIGYDDIYSTNFFKGTYSHLNDYTYNFQHEQSYIKPELFNDYVTQEVTLDPSDATFDRFDRVTWRNDEQFHVIKGTPSSDPFPEDYDEEIEVSVVLIRVTKQTTAPPDVDNEVVYLSNTGEPSEFDAVGTANVDVADTSDPQSGTTSILFDSANTSDKVTLTNDSLLNGSDISNFRFYVKPVIANFHRFYVRFYNGNTRVSNTIYISNGSFGFNQADLNWQLITLDLATLGISGDQFDNIQIQNRRSGATIMFDNMKLQTGLSPTVPPSIEYTSQLINNGDFSSDNKKYIETDFTSATNGQVPTWNGSEFVMTTPTGGGGGESFKEINQVGHGFSIGDPIKNNGTIYVGAIADLPENSDVIGIVSSVEDVDNFTFQYSGIYSEGSWTKGESYFLSTTNNTIVTEPTYSIGQVRQFIGTGVDGGLLLNINIGEEITKNVTSSEMKTRITETDIAGTYVFDRSLASVWVLTLIGSVVFSDINLATGTSTEDVSAVMTGDFPISFPLYWEFIGDSYDGTKWNFFAIETVNGNTGEERVICSISNI